MEKKLSYYEQLQHPKWQEKRLRIMERDQFECTNCGSSDTQLSVHHGYYERGRYLWNYPDETMKTLCRKCHPIEQEDMEAVHRLIASSGANLHFVMGLLVGGLSRERILSPGERIKFPSYEFTQGYAIAASTNAEFIFDACLKDGRTSFIEIERIRSEWSEGFREGLRRLAATQDEARLRQTVSILG